MSVRVGIGFGPFGDGASSSPSGFLRRVEQIEELGFDSIWLSDSATMAGPAPLVALAAAAARTSTLKLGTSVLVAPARNPVLLAKELATVDALSGGRLPAGVRPRHREGARGERGRVPRAERAARTEEAIEIVRLLWSGEPVTYEGRFASLSEVTLPPRPTRPSLDIWLGGSSPAALRRTGRLADGWLGAFVSPDELADLRRADRRGGRRGRPRDRGRSLRHDAVRRASAVGAHSQRHWRCCGGGPELALDDHVAIGAPALRELLERFLEAGADKFVVIPIAETSPRGSRSSPRSSSPSSKPHEQATCRNCPTMSTQRKGASMSDHADRESAVLERTRGRWTRRSSTSSTRCSARTRRFVVSIAGTGGRRPLRGPRTRPWTSSARRPWISTTSAAT